MTLNTELSREPVLAAATLINSVAADFLYQNKFAYAHFPELVDLAVVSSGLGMLQNNLNLVKSTGSFWDTTKWQVFPRPFLDCQSLAYANALAAWIRGENDPSWSRDLIADVKGPMKKSLKYLTKTDDSFVRTSAGPALEERTQSEWLQDANSKSTSTQIVAIRHFQLEGDASEEQELVLSQKLRSADRAILLHSIEMTQRLNLESDHLNADVVSELELLTEHRDDEVRAKAMCSLTRLGKIDENLTTVASKMLDSRVNFVTFAGLVGLSSLESVPDFAIPPANRAFLRSLQSCNYEFIGLFAAAFDRWLDDPKSHFQDLLAENSPEYLEIANEALENIRSQTVEIGKAS